MTKFRGTVPACEGCLYLLPVHIHEGEWLCDDCHPNRMVRSPETIYSFDKEAA